MSGTCPCGAALHHHRAVLCPDCRRAETKRYRAAWHAIHGNERLGLMAKNELATPWVAIQRACPTRISCETLDREHPRLRDAFR